MTLEMYVPSGLWLMLRQVRWLRQNSDEGKTVSWLWSRVSSCKWSRLPTSSGGIISRLLFNCNRTRCLALDRPTGTTVMSRWLRFSDADFSLHACSTIWSTDDADFILPDTWQPKQHASYKYHLTHCQLERTYLRQSCSDGSRWIKLLWNHSPMLVQYL